MQLHIRRLPELLLTLFACACASTGSGTSSVSEVPGKSAFESATYLEGTSDWKGALLLYTSAAKDGYAPAYGRLGRLHTLGNGTPVDHVEAMRWFTLAAEAGDIEGRYNLGCMYFFGRGVARDPALAAQHWRTAGEQGFALAQTNLGALYATGDGVELDHAQAVQWFCKAALNGDAIGQMKLGLELANGWGVEKNPGEAVRWMHSAAAQGNAEAQDSLADYALAGFGMEADAVEAAGWYWKAAQQSNPGSREAFDELDRSLRAEFERGAARGQRYVGTAYLEGIGESVDAANGFRILQLAAQQNDPTALMSTAHCWAEGIGTAENDENAAADCYRALKLGYAPAQFEYGILRDDQAGYTRESHAEALADFQAAAAQGHAGAKALLVLEPAFQSAFDGNAQVQCNLANEFSEGARVRRDFHAARHWLTLASDQGQTDAQLRLARLFAAGGDTVTVIGRQTYAPDPGNAAAYYRKVAEIGYVEAQVELAKLLVQAGNDTVDLDEAIRWANLAASNGDDGAIDIVQARVDARSYARLQESLATSAEYSDSSGYSDPPSDSPCGHCNGNGVLIREYGHWVGGHWWGDTYTTCLDCNGTGSLWH